MNLIIKVYFCVTCMCHFLVIFLHLFSFLQDSLYYEQLRTNVIAHDLLVDSLLYKVRGRGFSANHHLQSSDYISRSE